MRNFKVSLFIAITFFALQGFTSGDNHRAVETCETELLVIDDFESVGKYGAAIRVHNRSGFPVRVIIGGRDRGFLRGNAYANYGVHNGNYHVRTVWANGNYLYWNVSICCGRIFNCYTN